MFLNSGCTYSPRDSASSARLDAIKKNGIELGRAIDILEERFLGNHSRIDLWQELADRHQQVSAVACENAANHLASMDRLQGQKVTKVNRKGRRAYAQASSAQAAVHKQRRN